MKKIFAYVLCAAVSAAAVADDAVFELRLDKQGSPVSPTMYGLFFEDINYGADGGLYAELVKNRSFEFHPNHLQGWNCAGNVEVLSEGGPFDRNPHYVRLSDPGHREKRSSISNEGFFGIAVNKDAAYNLSLWARSQGYGDGKLLVELIDPASAGETQVLCSAEITVTPGVWQRYTASLVPQKSVKDGELRVFLADARTAVDVEHVSLFPADTYKGRPNGMRRDIALALEDLHPGVFRFPGGCIVEGTTPDTRYQWKNSVGPVENRPLNENRWQSTFQNRFYPDYFQTLGLGFYEYFQLCEDLGAAPLPVLNVGMVCQYQNSLENQIPLDSIQQYIDDAIDLIEFANGDTITEWGGLRARMGHPEPFGLKYLAIGNEQWGPEYVERLAPFVSALRQKHPEIKIIGSSGPNSEGEQFDYLWPEMRKLGVDLVDEHFYRNEQWFLNQGARYDKYPRKGPKVFAGEYACHGSGKKYNHFNAALLEAAFMTGLERNADIVEMATYAPLLAHVEGWQWRPDMIWFDNTSVARTASYYVQQIFSHNKGTRTVPLLLDGKAATGADGQNGLFASAVIDEPVNVCIVKIVNTGDAPVKVNLDMKLPRKVKGIDRVETITLSSEDPMAENTVGAPERISPVRAAMPAPADKRLADELPAHTFRTYPLHLK